MATKTLCSINGCNKPFYARGWCNTHYMRWRNNGDPEKLVRFYNDKKATCSIEGCDKPVKYRGWCKAHYTRWWRHGSPVAGRIDRGTAREYLSTVVLKHTGDNCLVWPFNRTSTGYGKIKIDGADYHVHRYVCEALNGPASAGMVAAHECGKGHTGCVNPRHITWKTPKENSRDRIRHGTHGRGERCVHAKLTWAKVSEIRSKLGVITQRELALDYGVGRTTIERIAARKTWVPAPHD